MDDNAITVMNLPDLNTDYPIAPEHIARFQRNGHILLRGVATTNEIAAYRPVILEARDKYGVAATPLAQRETYGKAFLKGMNLSTKVPGAAMAAGDATFHYGWTLHGTRVRPLDNANHQRDRDRWLPGLNPRDLAASELNPLAFTR